MSYTIHIERCDATGAREAIGESEWSAAIEANHILRFRVEDFSVRNPQTGELISIKTSGYDAELFCQETEEWIPTFFWSPAGIISFGASDDFGDREAPLRLVASALARSLNASLRGDEGEIYT